MSQDKEDIKRELEQLRRLRACLVDLVRTQGKLNDKRVLSLSRRIDSLVLKVMKRRAQS